MSENVKEEKGILKNKKICISIIGILIIVLLGGLYMVFHKDKSVPKDKYAKLFDIDAKEFEECMKEDGRSVSTEAFTFTLERYIYDKKMKVGFCEFAIQQNDGGNDLLKQAINNGIGKLKIGEDSYKISPFIPVVVISREKLEGNTLYYYVRFYDEEDDFGHEDSICINDKKTENSLGGDYYFELEDTIGTNRKSYSEGDTKMYLSPLVFSYVYLEDFEMNLSLTGDETDIPLIKNGSRIKDTFWISYLEEGFPGDMVFVNICDVGPIQKVMLNGEEYELK